MDPLTMPSSNVTTGAPPVVPPIVPESTNAKPRVTMGRDTDYLMRQATRIMQKGGSQADVIKYWQDVEGVTLKTPVQLPDSHADIKLKAQGAKLLNAAGDPRGLNYLMQIAQGVTFGFGDDGMGALYGLLTGKGASKGIDIYREALRQGQTDDPLASIVGQVGGAGIGGVLASRLPLMGATATGTGAKMALGAAQGGAAGAVAGAGNAQGGLSDRAKGAITGGLAGMLMGSIAGAPRGAPTLVGAGVGALADPEHPAQGAVMGGAAGLTASAAGSVLKPLIQGATAWSKTLQEALPGTMSPSATGRSILADAVQRDGNSIPELLTKLDKMAATGAPVTIADLGGENVLQLFAAAAGLRGPAKQKLVEDFTTRQAEQGTRLLGSLFRSLKLGSENAYDAADKVFAERASAATPLYNTSYALDFTPGPAFAKLAKEPWAKQAWEIGRNIAGEEDRAGLARVAGAKAVPPLETPATAPSAILGPSGAPAVPSQSAQLAASLPVRGLDYMQRGLNALRDARAGDGAPILDRQVWTARGQMLNDALDEAAQQHPVFSQARSVWKGPTAAMEALQLGKGGTLIQNGIGQNVAPFHTKPPEVITRELAKLSHGEQEMYRLGAFQDMAEWVHNVTAEAPNVAGSKFGGRVFSDAEKAMGQRLRALVHDPDVAQQLMDHVMAEARLSYTTPKMLQGSRTAPLAAAMQDLTGEATGGGIMRQIAGTVVKPALARAKTGWVDAVSDELSNIATKGLNGSDELRSLLLSLKGVATTYKPALAITAGSQAKALHR